MAPHPIPIPEQRHGPGFLLLSADGAASLPAGVPGQVLDLSRESPDVAAGYALFRRYLFDYRSELLLPMLILIDDRGLAHKVYPAVPSAQRLLEDLRLLREPDRQRLALPFAGRYFTPPHRNHFKLGAAFFWAGYPEQALVYLNEVIREHPDNGKAQLAVGFIHMEAGRDAAPPANTWSALRGCFRTIRIPGSTSASWKPRPSNIARRCWISKRPSRSIPNRLSRC